MSSFIRLDSATDSLDLSSVEMTGSGMQAMPGITGLGLPPVAQQWQEAAGDGKKPRGKRTLARSIDLPLLVQGSNRADFVSLMTRLSLMMADGCRFTWVTEGSDEWYVDVVREGGGDYTYGVDTADGCDLETVLTLTAGDPFWKRAVTERRTVTTEVRGLLVGSFANLNLASTKTFGQVTMDNPYDAKAIPVWTVYGPGDHFVAISSIGEKLTWDGTLTAGQWVKLDARDGSVVDQSGVNRYDMVGLSPSFWRIPPGNTLATVTLANTVAGQSKVVCEWQPRRWGVV